MRTTRVHTSRDVLLPLAAVGSLTAVGLVALPSLAGLVPAALWLGVAILVTLAILVLLPGCISWLAELLDAWAARSEAANNTLLLARLITFSVEVVLTQAILRRPVALVLGTETSQVESTIAAGALSLLLLLLVWTYQAARPVVRAWVFDSLDAAIPTVGTTTIINREATTQRAAPPTVKASVKAPAADTVTSDATRRVD
jgi:hypothetical protein